jgi:uncharacterized protein (TIGR03435 family)
VGSETRTLPQQAADPKPDDLPRFEVVSIKPATPGASGQIGCNYNSGRCAFSSTTFESLFAAAFNQERHRTAGSPAWMTSDVYQFEARAAGPMTREQATLMMQAVFFDRFNLKFHRETREVSGLELTVGKGGSKVKKADDQTPQSLKEQNSTILTLDEQTRRQISMSNPSPARTVIFVTQKASMAWLANILSRPGLLGPVVDATGLPGYYQFELRFQPEGNLIGDVPRIGPTLQTALDEQLGLKLQSKRVHVEFMVIDRLDKPTPN